MSTTNRAPKTTATDVILRTISFCSYISDIKVVDNAGAVTKGMSINHTLVNTPDINLAAYLMFDAQCNRATYIDTVPKAINRGMFLEFK